MRYFFHLLGRSLVFYALALPFLAAATGLVYGSPGTGYLIAFAVVAGLILAGIGSIVVALAGKEPFSQRPRYTASLFKVSFAIAVLLVVLGVLVVNAGN